MKRAAVLLIFSAAAFAQTFEVATIKPSGPLGKDDPDAPVFTGGPGTSDPIRFECRRCSPLDLIKHSYNLKRFQIDASDSLGSAHFDITAKVPADATPEAFRTMQQTLLAERFHLVLRREQRNMPIYSLTELRSGVKFRQHAGETEPEGAIPESRPQIDRDGFPILPKGITFMQHNDHTRWQANAESMPAFASMLSNIFGRPVKDDTNLKGLYDFTLSWTDEADLSDALQQQLGLKLTPTRGTTQMLVVDRIEMHPTEN